MKIIPIVVASDEGYIAPTYIALTSALHSKAKNNFYEIFFLGPDNISDEAKTILSNLIAEFDNTKISFINMGKRFADIRMTINHITVPTYYRLCLPEILSQYDKCIYVDSDVIVRNDLTELYDTDLSNHYIAGVLSEGIQKDKYYAKEICKIINIPDVKNYINAGVIVFNLCKLRKDHMTEKWIMLLNKKFPSQDQDILNATCFGKIKVLPLKYNVMTKCSFIKEDIWPNVNIGIYPNDDIKEAKNNPVIIHYADKYKPWNTPDSVLSKYWWDTYKMVSDPDAYMYITDFIRKHNRIVQDKLIIKLKNKIIRITQILGIYAYLKSR